MATVLLKNLRTIRERRGWSQAQLAAVVGYSDAFISQLETGKKQGSVTALKRLADALGVTTDQLLVDDDNGVGLVPQRLGTTKCRCR